MLLSGCGAAIPSNHVGRSVCPGALPNLTGTQLAADVDEAVRLQTTYENDAGFLAVVWDARGNVVVVDRTQLGGWQERLGPMNVAVAPSCIDSELLGLIYAALPRMHSDGGGSFGAGYDAVDDTIFVDGVSPDVVLQELDAMQPGARVAGLLAIGNGTLRIKSGPPGSRESSSLRPFFG